MNTITAGPLVSPVRLPTAAATPSSTAPLTTVAAPTHADQSKVIDPDEHFVRNPTPMWQLALTTAVLLCAAFVAEHDPKVSLRADHALTADVMEKATQGGNSLRRLVFFALAGVGVAHFLGSLSRGFRVGGAIGVLMFAYMAWAGISVSWAADPSLSSRRYIVLACCYAGLLGLSRNVSLREFCWITMWMSFAALSVGFATELSLGTFKPWSSDYRFSGTLHPNTQGMYLVAMSCAAWALLLRERRMQLVLYTVFAIGFCFIVLTKSRTSMAGLLMCLAVMWVVRSGGVGKYLAALAGGWFAVTAVFALFVTGIDVGQGAQDAVLMGRKEQSESLTGRLPLWEELSTYVAKRPLMGYGYDGFWTADHIDRVSRAMEWGIREAHNGYLETTLGLGLIGLGLVLSAVILGMIQSVRVYHVSQAGEYAWPMAMGTYALINSCTESGMTYPMLAPFSVCVGFAFVSLVDLEKLRQLRLERETAASGGDRSSTDSHPSDDLPNQSALTRSVLTTGDFATSNSPSASTALQSPALQFPWQAGLDSPANPATTPNPAEHVSSPVSFLQSCSPMPFAATSLYLSCTSPNTGSRFLLDGPSPSRGLAASSPSGSPFE